ncbi:MAG: hypothetical protein Q7R31_00360 [Candidatus Levybacteria bacterium]|nr:hypothetical protein [Candidatus Levybacteria bacterium]
MSEVLPKINATAEVAAQRAEIINSILKDGLKSAGRLRRESSLYFGSGDLSPKDFISFRLIFPPHLHENLQAFSNNLEDALYLRNISVLPVMTERPSYRLKEPDPIDQLPAWSQEEVDKNGAKEILEARISSSFLIVINETMDELMKKSSHFLFTSRKERFEGLETIGKPKEHIVPSDRFSYLIFPQTVWANYQNQKIQTDRNIRTRLVAQSIKRKLLTRTLSLSVPDYESALLEILNERKEPIWIHGVRLPTEDDIKRLK